MFYNFFPKKCRLWDNTEKYGRVGQATDDNIIRRMRIACWITKATDTHSEYVILIAFPRQQWWRKRASLQDSTWRIFLNLLYSIEFKIKTTIYYEQKFGT
jgi:hypothetical protein